MRDPYLLRGVDAGGDGEGGAGSSDEEPESAKRATELCGGSSTIMAEDPGNVGSVGDEGGPVGEVEALREVRGRTERRLKSSSSSDHCDDRMDVTSDRSLRMLRNPPVAVEVPVMEGAIGPESCDDRLRREGPGW